MTDLPNVESPPPGWYPDPVTGTGHRYWNGFAWTDEHSLDPGGTGGGLQPVGPWLGEAFKLVFERAGHLFTLIVVLVIPVSLVSGALTFWAIQDGVVTFEFDENDAMTGVGLVGIEASRVGLAALGSLLNLLASIVLAAAVSRHIVFARTDRAEPWSASLAGGLRRSPRVFGITLLQGLMIVGAAIALLGLPAVFPPLYILTIPAFIVMGLWAWSRLALATTAAAVAPQGVGSIKNSIDLSRGLSLPILGRLILLLLVVLAAQLMVSVVSAPFAGGSTFEPGVEELPLRDLMGGNAVVFGFQQVVGALASGFAAAIFGASMALMYLDLGGRLHDEFAHGGEVHRSEA